MRLWGKVPPQPGRCCGARGIRPASALEAESREHRFYLDPAGPRGSTLLPGEANDRLRRTDGSSSLRPVLRSLHIATFFLVVAVNVKSEVCVRKSSKAHPRIALYISVIAGDLVSEFSEDGPA
jgi:hypothetical protein